jgi:hypothetical protein
MLRPWALFTVSILHAAISAASVGVSCSTPGWVGRNLSKSSGDGPAAAVAAWASPRSHAAVIEVRSARISVSS